MSEDYSPPISASFDTTAEPLDEAAVRDEVSALFVTHAPALTRYLRSKYGDEHAEEFVQETFLRLYDVRVRGARIDKVEAWLTTVSRRIAISWWRKNGRDQQALHEFGAVLDELSLTASPEAIWLDQERMAAVKNAESRLTALERQCLSMRAQGLSLEQIGQQVEMNFRRVAEVVNRAIRKLNSAQQ
jgi:RNA polymerase sigma factor (sigma-70 family)